MKGKILVLLVSVAILVGILSGCTTTTQANKPPTASFTYKPMTGIYAGTEINFTDTSTDADGTIASWNWTFGDGAVSAVQNPMHAYGTVGTYTITLIVTDNDGNNSEPFTAAIKLTNVPPKAHFTYAPMINITANVTAINFTDASIKGDANITTWSWDFGDGTNSTLQNPTHKYISAETYTVKLTVTDGNVETDTTEVSIIVII